MNARLLDRLARRGLHLRRVGDDHLGVSGPAGGLPPEAVAFIRQHKAALLEALEERERHADFPVWLEERYRRAAIEAGSITWLDQAMLWPQDVYRAWEERAATLERGGLSRHDARRRAYMQYRQHNVTRFPTEAPGARGEAA